MSLQWPRLCQRGFDLSLEEPGRSESLGFYNKMHHYPEIIPSSEYRQQISYYSRGRSVVIALSLSLYITIVPLRYCEFGYTLKVKTFCHWSIIGYSGVFEWHTLC